MPRLRPFALAVLFAGSLLASLDVARAADPAPPQTRLLVVAGGDATEPQRFELDELTEGQSQQFITDSGTKVVVTRTADGLEVDVDGAKSTVKLLDGPDAEGEGDGTTSAAPHTRVIVHKENRDDHHSGYAFVVTDDPNQDVLVAHIGQVLAGDDSPETVVSVGGEGRRMKVVRIVDEHQGGPGSADAAAQGGEKREKIIIIEQKPADPAADEDDDE